MTPLRGPHHFTGITRDVETNVDFWCRVMGLRFVKNTLNFETTFRYHTYFGDEEGNPGTVVTFLEFKEAPPGVPGDGDIQRLVLRVASYDSLEYWMDRLIAENMHSEMLRLDPTSAAEPRLLGPGEPRGRADGLRHARPAADRRRRRHPGRAPHPRPRGRALVHDARGAAAVRPALRLRARRHAAWRSKGKDRHGRWYFSPPPGRPSGDGKVGVWHHIAFDAGDGDETQKARDFANEGVTPWTRIFDHYFFDSCYTMSPGGRMEICTTGPGFQLDEKLEDLGDRLCLSPRVEPLRARLEAENVLIVNPRPRSKGKKRKKAEPSTNGAPETAPPTPSVA